MAPWLAWLLPVPLATVGAIVYAHWTSRARGPEPAIDSVAEYDRFRSAMSNPVPAPRAMGKSPEPSQR